MKGIGGLLVLALGLLAGTARANPGWTPVGVTEGVAVERKMVENSPLFAFRGEGTFDVPIGLLVAVLKNHTITEEWVDLIIEHKVVRTLDERTNVIYESYGLPWPISDRDYVMKETKGHDSEAKVFTITYESVTDPSLPAIPGMVRAMAYRTFWRLEWVSPTQTRIEIEVFTDPKGTLPAWLINLIQKDWPWKTITGLVKRAQKGDIEPDGRVAAW